jgi:hypothetical protein
MSDDGLLKLLEAQGEELRDLRRRYDRLWDAASRTVLSGPLDPRVNGLGAKRSYALLALAREMHEQMEGKE